MSNELTELVRRLTGYSEDGWEIIYARKHENGSWDLQVQPITKEKEQEATNDNN